MSSSCAARRERSIIRLFEPCGPRSLIFTTTLLLFFRFVTLTIVPRGSVLCAAVKASLSYFSPLANSFSLHCISVEHRNACLWCADPCLRCNRRLSKWFFRLQQKADHHQHQCV